MIRVRSAPQTADSASTPGIGVTTDQVSAASIGTNLANMRHSAEAISWRLKRIKIGAKVVRHGRYVTLQMTEVAVPCKLFLEILRLIDGLRRSPPVPA